MRASGEDQRTWRSVDVSEARVGCSSGAYVNNGGVVGCVPLLKFKVHKEMPSASLQSLPFEVSLFGVIDHQSVAIAKISRITLPWLKCSFLPDT